MMFYLFGICQENRFQKRREERLAVYPAVAARRREDTAPSELGAGFSAMRFLWRERIIMGCGGCEKRDGGS